MSRLRSIFFNEVWYRKNLIIISVKMVQVRHMIQLNEGLKCKILMLGGQIEFFDCLQIFDISDNNIYI